MINIKNTLQRRLVILIPVILLVLGFAIFGNLYIKNFIQTNFPSLTKNTFFEPSTASLSIEDSKLHIDFDIAKNDQEEARAFSNSLGVGLEWVQGITISLDKQTLAKLNSSLPAVVNLEFKEKEVSFSSSSLPSLESALPGESYEFATDSGKLVLKTNGNNLKINIADPEPLLQYATSSGKFNLSSQLEPLFPLLQKIATINLRVRDKSLSGNITLK